MNNRMIHDYLEGELNSIEQDKLFAELNSNSLLREELDNQMQINKIIEMDRNATNTPAELTAALFHKLNYSISINDNSALVSKKKFYWWRYAVAMLLLLISIPMGYMIYDNYENNSNGTIAKINNSIKDNYNSNSQSYNTANNNLTAPSDLITTNNNSSSNNIASNSPIESSTEHQQKDRRGYRNGAISIKNANNLISNDLAANMQKNENANQNIATLIPSYYKYDSDNYLLNNLTTASTNSNNIKAYNLKEIVNNLFSLVSIEDYEININLKSSINSNPPTSISTSSNIYDNIALALWHKIANRLEAGVEAGRQSFTQNFTTSEGLIYSQAPTLNYIGIGLRYTADQIEMPLQSIPYFQFNIAASNIGPILNSQAGLRIASYSKMSFRIGIEYNNQFYIVNSQIYNSNNINLIGGFVYSF